MQSVVVLGNLLDRLIVNLIKSTVIDRCNPITQFAFIINESTPDAIQELAGTS